MADCDVLVYGPIAIDNIIRIPFLPTPEVDVIPTEDIYQIGAAAANTALWLATWQVQTRLCGHGIGHDYGGEIVWARLQEVPPLDISYLRRYHEHNTPMIRCLVTD
ncbi:MAG: hypothetical protein IT326_03545, partial [Anaerolineae bacterium]|nr:hypothetical protein [Anaerolineae bacterium]